jgi:dTDP-4-amino-4,6-dideoxygalactose transaminase
MIPILDLSQEIELLWDELNTSIKDVLRSGRFIMGEPVKELEHEIAEYLGVKHAIALNSGSDALLIGLHALGVGPGDEVITTPFTFFATAEPISLLGATPVFVDIDPKSYNIDASRIEEAISSRTKTIIPVHLFGQPADMDTIMDVANSHDLSVLEDTAQAFGSSIGGHKLGTIGDMGAFSFFPTKNLGAYGDSGMLVTDDDELAEKARMLRVHGARKKYHNEMIGYSSRLDTLQAAILRVKLPHVDGWNATRRQIAARYDEYLGGLGDLVLPHEQFAECHVYHQYTVRILNGRRNHVKAALAEQGIGSMIYYPVPLHKLPVYESMNVALPESEHAAGEVLSLPMWPYLSEDKQMRVVQVLRDVVR